jgi:ABC-type cobalamin/Fe3+-siderophores transport system ATPase subunit
MHVKRIIVSGFKALRSFDMELGQNLNIIVGDNETGKTTVLEAVALVLSGQMEGRSVLYDLDPYYFNTAMAAEYFALLRTGANPAPPQILIEAYLDDDGTNELARLKGTNNTRGEDCPGLSLAILLNVDLADDFKAYVGNVKHADLIPVEFFTVEWRSFAGNSVAARTLPFRATVIDTSLVRAYFGPNKYLAQIIAECLKDEKQRISLAAAYRQLKHSFMDEPGIKEINDYLMQKKGDITGKALTLSLDMSARSTWESSITAHLDDVPFSDVGKGEQSRVQMKLAIEAATDSSVLLVEEPENHLSHSNMSRLIDEISRKAAGRQILITTHSSFVLNKLGLDRVKLLSSHGVLTLKDLSSPTTNYFMKLPGYDTLRLLLSARTILVEGPSDELIVQKAYREVHGKLPLDDGVDVIAVGSLAFKRFLEIGAMLKQRMCVVTDNDGDVAALREKYKDYLGGQHPTITICFDEDETCNTLEPQLLKANPRVKLNEVFGTTHRTDEALLAYMKNNKTDCALKVLTTTEALSFPEYIRRATQA